MGRFCMNLITRGETTSEHLPGEDFDFERDVGAPDKFCDWESGAIAQGLVHRLCRELSRGF
jgi:hypothetical protein